MLTNTLAGARLPETPSTFSNIPPNFQNTEKEKNERPLTGLGLLAPGYPKAYLREALKLVSKYDGHNISVWQFARACKRAKESISLIDEAAFVKMLRNKLINYTYLAVENKVHPTVEKFLNTLKRVFGPGRIIIEDNLASFSKNQINTFYIGRIKDLRTAIIEGDQTNLDRPLNEIEIMAIDSLALETFYEGLPREYQF